MEISLKKLTIIWYLRKLNAKQFCHVDLFLNNNKIIHYMLTQEQT